MKKFNPEKELSKIQNKKSSLNTNSHLKNIYIPVLVIACSTLAILGITFSTNITTEKETYTIKIDIINGKETSYINTVEKGSFSDIIASTSSFGSLKCTSGSLNYDPLTYTVYNNNVTEDISCVLSFMDDGIRSIDLNNLNSIADNDGLSYYYKGDATNNYLKINNLLFRIVRINGDGTYRLILDNSINISGYGTNNEYLNSNVINALNEWYQSALSTLTYTVEKDYDLSNYVTYDSEDLINFNGYYISKVGLLSVKEVRLINNNITSSYLDGNHYLANSTNDNKVWAIVNNKLTPTDPTTVLNIRPVINIKVSSLQGDGTINNPYIIEE